MAFVLIAKWTAKEGEDERLWELIQQWVGPTRQEPGNLMYVVHRSRDNPRLFMFYEQYVDEAALDAHRSSEHFQQIAVPKGLPLVETRELEFYETLDV
jgi:quinol monooxygenase YgiN